MTIRIVTDSTCDLETDAARQAGIEVVPLYINVGNQGYLDGVELARQTFYEQLPHYSVHPTTAAPGIEAFRSVYERLAEEGASAIVSLHVARSLSQVVDFARLAAEGLKSIPIKVIDSGQLTLGVGLTALHGSAVARAGGALSEVVEAIERRMARTHTFAALATVEFLRRSGRLTQFQYGLASLLRVIPLLKMHQGVADMERLRGHQRALARVVALAEALGPLEELAIVHTNDLAKALRLRDRVEHLVPPGSTPLFGQVTPVIGAHIGPGAAGVVCVTRE